MLMKTEKQLAKRYRKLRSTERFLGILSLCSCRIAVYLLLLKTIKPIPSLMLIINTLHISKAKHKSLFPFRCGKGNKWQRQLNLPQLNKIYKTTVYSSTFDPIQRRKQYILNKCLFREAICAPHTISEIII